MNKKPAVLSDSLLAHRPRKGEARPQTESEAAIPASAEAVPSSEATSPNPMTGAAPGRRRKRRSQNTQQLNLRVSEGTLERFTKLADKENLIFGDLLTQLLDAYEKR